MVTVSVSDHKDFAGEPAHRARRDGWIALAALLVAETVGSLLFLLRGRVALLQNIRTIPIGTVLAHWILPFLIVCLVERRDAQALGLTVGREGAGAFAIYALVRLVLPALIVGVDSVLLVESFEHIVYIGVAEEVFFRGYLTGRLCHWLGDLKGLLLSGLIFGLAHADSRLSQHGLAYPAPDAPLGLYTSFGGLRFGFIYLRAKNIVPGTIPHMAMNAYLGRVLAMLCL